MTQTELLNTIRKEIERLIKKDNYELFDVPALLSFLDNLQESDKYTLALSKAREWFNGVNQGGQAILIYIFPELGEGLDPRYSPQEPEVNGLEEEIATWIPKHIKCEREPDTRKAIIEWAGFIARHFAEWGAKHK